MLDVIQHEQQGSLAQSIKKLLFWLAAGVELEAERFGNRGNDEVGGTEGLQGNEVDAIGEGFLLQVLLLPSPAGFCRSRLGQQVSIGGRRGPLEAG